MARHDQRSEQDGGGDELTARVAELEARMARLEGGGAADGEASATVRDPEVFWALEGLRTRSEDDGAVLFTGAVRLPSGERAEWQEGFSTDSLLDADWSLCADTLAALGHPIRLILLREVLRGARTAAELGTVEELSTSGQLYHHLRPLLAAGWLRTSGRGRYEVPAPKVVPLLTIIGGTQP